MRLTQGEWANVPALCLGFVPCFFFLIDSQINLVVNGNTHSHFPPALAMRDLGSHFVNGEYSCSVFGVCCLFFSLRGRDGLIIVR